MLEYEDQYKGRGATLVGFTLEARYVTKPWSWLINQVDISVLLNVNKRPWLLFLPQNVETLRGIHFVLVCWPRKLIVLQTQPIEQLCVNTPSGYGHILSSYMVGYILTNLQLQFAVWLYEFDEVFLFSAGKKLHFTWVSFLFNDANMTNFWNWWCVVQFFDFW
jgi:hypothetical protein